MRAALAPLLAELPRLLESAARDRTRHDAGEGARALALIERAREALGAALRQRDVEALAAEFARRTSSFQRGQLLRQVRAALGVDIPLIDRRLPALIEGFVGENVALIQDLPVKTLGEIQRAVTRAISSATPHQQLAEEIEDRLGIATERAKLIARDQIGKIYGQVNAARQRDLGVDQFIWRTVRDERVRDEHSDREGQIFSYSDPPEDGLPGEAVNCRCFADPVLDPLIAAAE